MLPLVAIIEYNSIRALRAGWGSWGGKVVCGLYVHAHMASHAFKHTT